MKCETSQRTRKTNEVERRQSYAVLTAGIKKSRVRCWRSKHVRICQSYRLCLIHNKICHLLCITCLEPSGRGWQHQERGGVVRWLWLAITGQTYHIYKHTLTISHSCKKKKKCRKTPYQFSNSYMIVHPECTVPL